MKMNKKKERERESWKENLVSFLIDREIAQLAGGLTPGFDHHEGLVAVINDGLGVVDELDHLVEDTLGGDLGEGLLAVLD